MYAVFICTGEGASWNTLKAARFPRFITETQSGAYNTVILRLDTESRPDAYQTKPDDIDTLFKNAVSLVASA
jgi:hypothetical protein